MKRIVPVACKCETETLLQEREERQKQEWFKLCEAFTSKDKLVPGATLDNYKSKPGCANAIRIARDFVSTYNEWKREGAGLYFCGMNGLGKTHLLTGIYHGTIALGISTVYMTTYDLFQQFQVAAKEDDNEYKYKLLNVLYNCEVLLLDDIGGEVPYESRAEKLLDVINARNGKRLTVYSSNFSLDDLEKWFNEQGPRIADRIIENSIEIKLTGESHRFTINEKHNTWLERRLNDLGA